MTKKPSNPLKFFNDKADERVKKMQEGGPQAEPNPESIVPWRKQVVSGTPESANAMAKLTPDAVAALRYSKKMQDPWAFTNSKFDSNAVRDQLVGSAVTPIAYDKKKGGSIKSKKK